LVEGYDKYMICSSFYNVSIALPVYS